MTYQHVAFYTVASFYDNVSRIMKKRKLNPQELLFVNEYFRTSNAYRSAITAGYSEKTARALSSGWIGHNRNKSKNKGIWDEVQKRREKLKANDEINESKIIREYNRIALFDPRNLYDNAGETKRIIDLDDDTAAAIGSKMVEKTKALDALVKISGMNAPEKVEIDLAAGLSKEEREIIKPMAEQAAMKMFELEQQKADRNDG